MADRYRNPQVREATRFAGGSTSASEVDCPAGTVATRQIGAMCGPVQGIAEGDWLGALDYAERLGLNGVLFATPHAASPGLEHAELADVGAAAGERGLFVETGIGFLGPADDPTRVLDDLVAAAGAAVALGCTQFFAYTRTERQRGPLEHRRQLAQIEHTLRAMRPFLKAHGCRLNIKTHEDLSSVEVLRLVQTLGTDVFGVSLDVANLVVRGEDPAAATRRLAPYVHQTHLEDVALYFVASGLRRKLRPCGAGVLDWGDILGTLLHDAPGRHLVLEQHRGQFDVDIFDPAWFDAEPHVRPPELARLVHAAVTCERRAVDGSGPTLDDLSGVSDPASRADELRRSADHIRSVLDSIRGVAA